ncbi:MAG: tetratricopeptide repeat protein [Candidatus Krumholzibacteria bacterium]|nr:tetratricopeptide repeat protein [Candidatus Krumholzibacteria bacterium]
MRALIYTILLSAILVVSVMYLRGIKQGPVVGGDKKDETRMPVAVQSEPPPLSGIDVSELEQVNETALYETGCELLDLWHVREAIGVFEALVERNQNHQQANLRLVECYSHPLIASEKRAAECWKKARKLAIQTGQDTLWVSAFRSLFIEFLPSSAIRELTAVVNRNAQNLDARFLLAVAHHMNANPDEAERHVRELLAGDQSLGRARELLIHCEISKGEYQRAENLARDLAALYPEEPYPYVLLSRVLLMRGNLKEAVEFCDSALHRDKRYIPAIIARAHLYTAQGDAQAARVSFEKLVMFDDPVLASVGTEGKAHVDFLYGRFDEAKDNMDEAIRLAMSAHSMRRGVFYAFRLVDYLCELGRVDAAKAVLDRWVSRQTQAPSELGELRILISRGSLDIARHALEKLRSDKQLQPWMQSLGLDYVDIEAQILIGEKDFAGALSVLQTAEKNGVTSRRDYLTGYALFQKGEAESAVGFFDKTRIKSFGLAFPYHDDPVLAVQAIFYLAEAALARGEGQKAQHYYQDFLEFWGGTKWDLQAVERARSKLQTLSMKSKDE